MTLVTTTLRAMTDTAPANAGSQRTIALVVLLVLGVLSLPVTAAFLDGESTDQLILPVQLVLMAVVGAVVGYLLPGLGGPASTKGRSAAIGAVIGVVLGLLGAALFYLALD